VPTGGGASRIAVLHQSHDAEQDRALDAEVDQGLSRGYGYLVHGNILGKSGKRNLSRVMQRERQDGCPRLPVTAARRMRWLMVRAVIEGCRGCRVDTGGRNLAGYRLGMEENGS
jgi:hypothetical protein